MVAMPAPLRLRLDQRTREAVAERYEHTRGAVERTNCQMVLLADEGRHAPEIAWLVRRGPHQVRKVLRRFPNPGPGGGGPRQKPRPGGGGWAGAGGGVKGEGGGGGGGGKKGGGGGGGGGGGAPPRPPPRR